MMTTMHFLIDGYNLLHAMGILSGPVGPHGLTKARTQLLGQLSSVHIVEEDATVVFDARGAPAGVDGADSRGAVHVIYALREEADDIIENLIAHDSVPAKLVVVSNDRRLREAAGRRGCQPWLCDQYLDWIDRTRRERLRAKPEVADKPASISEAETERWLREFGEIDHDWMI